MLQNKSHLGICIQIMNMEFIERKGHLAHLVKKSILFGPFSEKIVT